MVFGGALVWGLWASEGLGTVILEGCRLVVLMVWERFLLM